MTPLCIPKPHFRQVVGTGGIGSGIYFAFEGNHTLGREESRMARLMPGRDYCKLHIVAHYLAVFLGDSVPVYPIGVIGNDAPGKMLLREMESVGLQLEGVRTLDNVATLYSICFQYPDGTGGNITTSESASSWVSTEDVDRMLERISPSPETIVLTVPEVPLKTRLHLLQRGRKCGCLNVASCATVEIPAFVEEGGLELTDLLAVNLEEAAALTSGTTAEKEQMEDIIASAVSICHRRQPSLKVSITCGADGACGYEGGIQVRIPPLKAHVVASGGAGDTYLAGVLLGLCAGLPFLNPKGNRYDFAAGPLASAMDLGTAMASMSVTTEDTIHWGMQPRTLREYLRERGAVLDERFAALFCEEG